MDVILPIVGVIVFIIIMQRNKDYIEKRIDELRNNDETDTK